MENKQTTNNKNYYLAVCSAKSDDLQYGWSKVNNIEDIHACIGWLCNISFTQIKVSYLEYYNYTFDTFEDYAARIRNKADKVVAKLNFDNTDYVIKLLVKGEDI